MSLRIEDRSRVMAIASIVLAVLGGLWSAIGAFYPGTALGVVAAAMAFAARRRGPEGQRALANAGLVLGLLVVAAGVVLAVLDS